MANYLDPNNIYDAIETDLNAINLFFTHHISIQFNAKNFEMRKQFYNFKFQLNNFVGLVLF